jgi:hypothetical protein
MQRAKAIAPFCVVVVATVVDEATLATPGEPRPPPQPAASSENALTATTALAIGKRRPRMMFGSLQVEQRKPTTTH